MVRVSNGLSGLLTISRMKLTRTILMLCNRNTVPHSSLVSY